MCCLWVLPLVEEQVRVFSYFHMLVIVGGSASSVHTSSEREAVRVLRLDLPDATETMVFEIFLKIEGGDLRVVDPYPSRGLSARVVVVCGHQGVVMTTLCGALVNHNPTQSIHGFLVMRAILIVLLREDHAVKMTHMRQHTQKATVHVLTHLFLLV